MNFIELVVLLDFKKVKHMVEEYFNGQYEVLKFLGEGSFAQVFLVKQTFLNDKRAMKIIKEPLTNTKNIDSVFHEVRIATQLRHKNILDIYDAGLIHDFAYFVLEYVSGGDLEDYRNSYMKSNKPIPIHIILDIIEQILLGLNTLHSSNPIIIHRDLKTKNILMNYSDDEEIIVKISDFGFARELSSNPDDYDIGGTKPYMAPECFSNVFSTETDTYAVGVILYLLLTGELPYEIEDFALDDIVCGKPWEQELKSVRSFNENIPDYIENIALKSISIEPENRYKDAKEFLDDLNLAIDRFKDSDYYKESLKALEDENYLNKEGNLINDNSNHEFTEADFKNYPINENIREAFRLAKMEDRLDEAISILEKEVLRDYEIRKYYGKVLRLWKGKYPDAKLISEAFTVTLKGKNYKLAINLLKEAFAYNPILKESYGHFIDLWSIFIDLGKDKDLKMAIDSLENLMNENDRIYDTYKDSINILRCCDEDDILTQTLSLAEKGELVEASKPLEFLVVYDENIREDYSYKLSLYKQDLRM